MKKTQTATFTFNLNRTREAITLHYNSGCTLQDAITADWNDTPIEHREVVPFRKAITAMAIADGYGETYIRRTLAAIDELRVRKTSKTMSATKKAKAKAKGPKGPVTFTLDRVSEVLADQGFSKADIKAVLAALASK